MDSLILILILGVLFGSMYFVYDLAKKAGYKHTDKSIGRVITSFPVNHKMSGHIIKIDTKYFFCLENCGIVEIDYSDNLDKIMDSPSFQSILAKQIGKLKEIKKKQD